MKPKETKQRKAIIDRASIDTLVHETLGTLGTRLDLTEASTPQIAYLYDVGIRNTKYDPKKWPPRLRGDDGLFYHDWQKRIVLFSPEFKDKWLTLFETHNSGQREREIAMEIFLLHEFFHKDQFLTSPRHGDIRQAQAVLRALDYHADANAALAARALREVSEKSKQDKSETGFPQLAEMVLGVLRAIEVFNVPTPSARLNPLRFLRYFTWHYQYHRSQRFQSNTDQIALQLLFEPVVSIYRLSGRNALSPLITRDWPNQLKHINGSFLWLAVPNRFAVPAVHRFRITKRSKIVELFHGIFDGDVTKTELFFEELFEAERWLIGEGLSKPSPRGGGGGGHRTPSFSPFPQMWPLVPQIRRD